MKWKKLGKIFDVDNIDLDWIKSHASVPFAENIKDNIFKVYFSTRDRDNRSNLGYFIFDLENPQEILEVSHEPVIKPGELGTFDDSGTMGSCIINISGKRYLYYIGWNLGVTVPFRNSIGLAVCEKGQNKFEKVFDGPIIDRTAKEPHFCASNCVLFENNTFKMWYLSCVKWIKVDDEIRHYYNIKYAESEDGIEWKRNGEVAIDFKDEYEYAISVPRVIHEDGVYKMWFSSRGSKENPTYRIRYAESKDGKKWIRKEDDKVLDISKDGWDSDMVCYPYVFNHNGRKFMLYNGNNYGKTGIGLAILEKE